MTIRNLQYLFEPRSVAIVGASERTNTVGSVLMRNVLDGGFAGPIFPVNPKRSAVHGAKAYPSVSSLPQPCDLAVIATPPETVPGLVAELGRAGTKAAVVITAGFGEGGQARGRELQEAMLNAARPHLLRIIGPNCLGVLMPYARLNASFAGSLILPGKVAFVTQSGAIATAVIDWATTRGIGFSHVLTLGDMADVDFGDSLDYLARDSKAAAILLYIEAVTHARKFMSAARAAARTKPVIVVKGGRFAEGAKAAASHTGALAGVDKVYDAAFRRAGMLRVLDLEELFDAVETLSKIGVPKGERLAILTNGGGAGVLATDALVERGGTLAQLARATIETLDQRLPRTWSHANPVDIIGDATAERYSASLEAVLADPGVDAVLVLNCPTAIVASTEPAKAVVAGSRGAGKTVTAAWLGGASADEARAILEAGGIPCHATPTGGARAFMHLVGYRRSQDALMATPPSVPAEFALDSGAVRAVIDAALGEEREWLSGPETKRVIEAYGIPTASTRIAKTAAEAEAIAATLGTPVALKIHSRDITHKSDVGGVALDLATPAAVRREAEAMQLRVADKQPSARIEGFTIEAMVRRPHAHELIVGMNEDAQLGPVILFGEGGVAVEVRDDTTLELPPLDMQLASRMIERTRVHRILAGYRDRPPADLAAIALTLVKVSQLVIDFDEIRELDINPLIADAAGVIALDARIRVQRARGHPHRRLAIKPYPKELERPLTLKDGRDLLVRPIRAEDEPMLIRCFGKLTPDEVRMRFHLPMTVMDHLMAARFTQINYDREMALILIDPSAAGTTEIYAVIRLAADPDNEKAEYAVIVRDDLAGQGIGRAMMERLIAYARSRGIKQLFGDVLAENARMLNLCAEFGFTSTRSADNPSIVTTRLEL